MKHLIFLCILFLSTATFAQGIQPVLVNVDHEVILEGDIYKLFEYQVVTYDGENNDTLPNIVFSTKDSSQMANQLAQLAIQYQLQVDAGYTLLAEREKAAGYRATAGPLFESFTGKGLDSTITKQSASNYVGTYRLIPIAGQPSVVKIVLSETGLPTFERYDVTGQTLTSTHEMEVRGALTLTIKSIDIGAGVQDYTFTRLNSNAAVFIPQERATGSGLNGVQLVKTGQP